jgi:chromosome segregation ATPase
MNRSLQYFNLLGVVALGVLCVFQWQANRRANLDEIALEKTRQALTAKVEEQSNSLKNLTADLEGFREQLAKASVSAKESDAKLRAAEREISSLTAERDQLKTNVVTWAEAVAARDARLNGANEVIQKTAAERDKTIARFNTLAEKHNAVVKELNESLARIAAFPTNANPVTPSKK